MLKTEHEEVEKLLEKSKSGIELTFDERVTLLNYHHKATAEKYSKPLVTQTKQEIGSDIIELLSDGVGYRDLIETRINFLFDDCNSIINELSRKEIIDNYLFEYDMNEESQQIIKNHFSKVEQYYNSLKGIIDHFEEMEEYYSEMCD